MRHPPRDFLSPLYVSILSKESKNSAFAHFLCSFSSFMVVARQCRTPGLFSLPRRRQCALAGLVGPFPFRWVDTAAEWHP